MRRLQSDNTFGAVKWRLRRYKGTPADYARIENCHRQSKRWFMRVYALYMNNGWVLRHPSNEHLGY